DTYNHLIDNLYRSAEIDAKDEKTQKRMRKFARRFDSSLRWEVARLVKASTVRKRDEFDKEKHLINAPNCTINLKTGSAQKHNASDLLMNSLSVKFDPKAKCPRFRRFLFEISGGADAQTKEEKRLAYQWRKSLRHHLGYLLTGETKEQKLFVY